MGVDDLWLVWDEAELAGYAHAKVVETVLVVEDLILAETVNPGQALEALAREAGATYIQVKVSQPSQLASLRQAGFQIAQPHWSAFMVKPLALGVTVNDFRHLFEVGSERFMISRNDIT